MLVAGLCRAYRWTPATVRRLTTAKALRYADEADITLLQPGLPRARAAAPASPRSWDLAMRDLAAARGDQRSVDKINGYLASRAIFGEVARA